MYTNIYYARLIETKNTLIVKVFRELTPCRPVYIKRSYEHTAVFRNVRNYMHLPVDTVYNPKRTESFSTSLREFQYLP
jgi:hypothetical protein